MNPPISRVTRPEPTATTVPDAPLRAQALADVLAAARAFYHDGLGNGETTHWPCLDEYWTWLKGEVTAITGYPNHGKSRLIHAVMLLKAAFSGWRFVVYVPENEEDFFVEMAQMLVGRTANIKAPNSRMALEELEAAIVWVHAHFTVLEAPEGATPGQLLAEVARLNAEARATGQRPYDSLLKDPWNQLIHAFQAREDLYLSEQFSGLKRFAVREDMAVVVTAHPAGQAKDKNGTLVRPDAYTISGGKMWNNKFDNVLAVFRSNFPGPEVELWIHKIKKQGRVGKPGMVELTYDFRQSRYFPLLGDSRHPLDSLSFNAPGTAYADVHVGPALIRSLPTSTDFSIPTEKAPF